MGSQNSHMGAHSLQVAHNRLQLCTFVAFFGAAFKGELSLQNDDNCRHLWTSTFQRNGFFKIFSTTVLFGGGSGFVCL